MRKEQLLLLCSCAALLVWLNGCADLKNPTPNPVSTEQGVHPREWTDTSSSGFHGAYLQLKQWDPQSCAPCHGATFAGGTSNVACATCHNSVPHQAQFTLAGGGHVGYLKSHAFPLTQCQTCHGTGYTGGTRVHVSCSGSGCHVDAQGTAKSPEACNTCHGTFRAAANDTISFAPPRGVNGDTSSTSRAAGAHQAHLTETELTAPPLPCSSCHVVPATVNAPGHLDAQTAGAEVVIKSALAKTVSNGVTPNPTYDPASMKCAGTYCHGNFRLAKASAPSSAQFAYSDVAMVGENASPLWTAGEAGTACGTCHGLPPRGHVNFAPNASCADCHLGVVNSAFQIVDKSKHMNGKINVFGTERPY